jgi:hypothetical protein
LPPLNPLPLVHFLFSAWVLGSFATAAYTALIGVWGINHMTPSGDLKKAWGFWVLFGLGIVFAGWIAWESARQLQDADLQKRTADSQRERDLDSVQGRLDEISGHDKDVSEALKKIADAAHLPSGGTANAIADEIIKKLPSPLVVAKIRGTGNATTVGGGNAATGGGAAAQQQTVNAPNGIGTIGGTLINPQVTNLAPPPAKLSYTEKLISQVGDKKIMELHISTDRTIKTPTIGFTYTGSFNDSDAYWSTHAPLLGGLKMAAYNWGKINDSSHVAIPNSFGVILEIPPAFSPGNDLVLTLELGIDSHVSSVTEIQ